MTEYSDELRLPFSITVRMPRQPDGSFIGEGLRAPPPGALPDISPGSRRPNQAELVMRAPQPTARATVHNVTVGIAPSAAVPKLAADAVVTVIVAGIALPTSIPMLPVVLASVAATALVIVIASGVRYAFTHRAAALAWARQVVDAVPLGDAMPMPNPLPPLPPTQAKPELPAHTGNEPAVPLPPLPGGPVTLPTVVPGLEVTQLEPFILETGGGTSSRGARQAARKADPEVIET